MYSIIPSTPSGAEKNTHQDESFKQTYTESEIIEINADPDPTEAEILDMIKEVMEENSWDKKRAEFYVRTTVDLMNRDRKEFFAFLNTKTDHLTNLDNKREFDIALIREISRADRYRLMLRLELLDFDFFKKINDQLGHPVGDTALQILANIIRDSTRREDIKARIGGEEFAIIRVNAGEENIPAERLRANVEARFKKRLLEMIERYHPDIHKRITADKNSKDYIDFDEAVAGTISIGFVTFTGGEEEAPAPSDMIRMADDALLEAKKSGRNQIAYHEDGENVILNKETYRKKLFKQMSRLLKEVGLARNELDQEEKILRILEISGDTELIRYATGKISEIREKIRILNTEINGHRRKMTELLAA